MQNTRVNTQAGHLAIMVGICVLVSFGAWLGCQAVLSSNRDAVVWQEVVVQPGDTLWSLAAAHGIEGMTTGELAWRLSESNGVSAELLRPGDRLLVPAGHGAGS